jgi:hypothetical protein
VPQSPHINAQYDQPDPDSHAVGSPPANMPQRCFALRLRQPAEILACGRKRPERTIAGGLAMIGLAQALRLLLEINRRP